MAAALLALLLLLTAAGGATPTPRGGSPASGGEAEVAAPALAPEAPARPAAIRAYHDSGAWERDRARQIRRAAEALTTALDRRPPARPAIVLDIDDTSLSNYACLKRAGFDRSRADCGRRADLPAIAPTRALFRLARARGVEVHFITGRSERMRANTARNLRTAGYRGRWRLHMRPDREAPGTRDGWKARTRRGLTRRGRTILVSVGDQRSDLTGGWARRAFKLPNPMYVIPAA